MEFENLAYVVFFIIYIVYQVFFKGRSADKRKSQPTPRKGPQPQPSTEPSSKPGKPETLGDIFREIMEKKQPSAEVKTPEPEPATVESSEVNPYMEYLDKIPEVEGGHAIKRQRQLEVEQLDDSAYGNVVNFKLKEAVIYDAIMNRPYS